MRWMKREYKITKSDLGFNVFREPKWWGIKEWLQKDSYNLNQEYAKIFYSLDDATSALMIARAKWKKETPTIFIKKSGWVDLEERK